MLVIMLIRDISRAGKEGFSILMYHNYHNFLYIYVCAKSADKDQTSDSTSVSMHVLIALLCGRTST